MKRSRFIHAGIACDVFQSDETNKDTPVGMYLYGFPGSIGEAAPTRALLSLGYTVLQPHYPGSYDSAGTCIPTTAFEMVETLSAALAKSGLSNIKDGSPLSLSKSITVCIGHSFGSFVALRTATMLNQLTHLILLGPAIAYGPDKDGCGLREDGPSHIAYVQRSRPFTYRLGDHKRWLDLYQGRYDGALGRAPASLREIRLIAGENDKYFDLSALSSRCEQIVERALPGAPNPQLNLIRNVGHGPAGLLDSLKL